jgi:hypothetical protein
MLAITLLCALATHAEAGNNDFTLEADYADSKLTALRFDYRAAPAPTGVYIGGKMLPGSGCFARIPGSDTLTPFLESIKNQPGYYAVADTRKRMQQAMDKINKDIWQEILCVAVNTFPETVKDNPGKWSSVPIYVDGKRQGAWTDVLTVVRPNHLYSITVNPRRQPE